MVTSRRRFLVVIPTLIAGSTSLARARQGGLDQFGVSAPPCGNATVTPAVPADRTFKAGSPERASLLETGMVGTPLSLTGTVSGVTCGRIKGARIDFWQADAKGVYDPTGFRLRGHQLTNADGQYHLTTVVPGAVAGRAPHLGVNVQALGKANFWTEIFFPDEPGNLRDARYKPDLAMKTTRAATGRAGIFDIVLDL